jgi:hypothetical protein
MRAASERLVDDVAPDDEGIAVEHRALYLLSYFGVSNIQTLP